MEAGLTTATRHINSRAFAFARHDTFHVRDGWLIKGLDAINNDSDAFYHKDAHHSLGVGKNMLRAISYWVRAMGLVEPQPDAKGFRPQLQETPLASIVKERDPYLEDEATLWALHLELASNQTIATFWYFAFNEYSQRDFTEVRIAIAISEYLESRGIESVAESSIHKDARCFLRTYLPSKSQSSKALLDDSLDSPLAALNLLKQTAVDGHYKFQVGARRNLPLLIFAYALYRFQEFSEDEGRLASLEDLRWGPYSPGRLLGLDMRSILDYLEELEVKTDYARLIRTAGLSVVSLKDNVSSLQILEEYYASVS